MRRALHSARYAVTLWSYAGFASATSNSNGNGLYTQVFTIDCMLYGLAKDVNLHKRLNDSSADEPETFWHVCVKQDEDVLYFAQTSNTTRVTNQFGWGDFLTMTLQAAPEWGFDASGYGHVFNVLDGVQSAASPAITPIAGRRLSAGLTRRYFTGQRRIRLLTIVVEVNGQTVATNVAP